MGELEKSFTELSEYEDKKDAGYIAYQIGVLYSDEKLATYYDIAQAEEWLKKAAEFENHAAAYQLAQIYADETKPLYDISKAMKWYEEAALQDNDMAMYKLGKMYIEQPEDNEAHTKGMEWLKKAADEYENTYAQYTLGNIFHEQENEKMAFQYWSKAADADNEYGIWRVGRCYLWGIGVEKDVDKGMEYLKYAVEKYESEFAAREMENYNSMSFKALSYGIFRMFFDELTRLTNQSKRRFDRLEHEKSRQAKKEEVLHRD